MLVPAMMNVHRREDGTTTFLGEHSTLEVRRPCPGVLLVTISGNDVGEFGSAPLVEITPDAKRGPLHLFIDARRGQTASMDVSHEWAAWMKEHHSALESISMLTGSKFIQLTASFVRSFADLGEKMRIYTSADAFDEELATVIRRS
jgi:hypothetical protein